MGKVCSIRKSGRCFFKGRPTLLVLDEGHTPRNNNSQIWKALKKVSTRRRIILSGTPFQNSFMELFNTLCVVNPKFADQDNSVRGPRWKNLDNSSGINRGAMLGMRAVLKPYVHVHKGSVLEEKLPGLRHTLVFLHPTKSQQLLLEKACKEEMFKMIRMVSLVSVHPSIHAVVKEYFTRREEIATDINAGVKARFLLKLVQFADALSERVLIFSQFLDSLVFIKEQLESIYSWNEGREVVYIDGQVDEKKRQESIYRFNDETSEAKGLFSLGEEHSEYAGAGAVAEDKVLEAMRSLENFNQIFEKIISQPKESDLIETFGMEGQK
ncbi:hypothetical protein SASPL_131545 [Salvia splendens]|uniref:Helicase ATP-binding domain-containing protein n=1 Tax=Salvia splendens TaxID=180675 RepID=A0A8X8X8Y8_SALSN|nr:hypothetical protein SASPL_131545 [Salvia splendens]